LVVGKDKSRLVVHMDSNFMVEHMIDMHLEVDKDRSL
jgi:hypothetical protein